MITALLVAAYLMTGVLFMKRAWAKMLAHNVIFRKRSNALIWAAIVTVLWLPLWGIILACKVLEYKEDRR